MATKGTDNATGSASYQVLARRFRPKTLDEVAGQVPILDSLRTALVSGRVPHAFLFSGSRGVGKTTLARILARCLNCEEGVSPAPCGKCGTCQSILAGQNGDVLEIDAASHNLVDDIRALRDRVGFASMGARYKVYILDEVHMLTRNAFNAFLKTLEEPPPNVVFILATTEQHKVPETIRSRCQVLLFQNLAETDIVARLSRIAKNEGLVLSEDIHHEIARGARGGMRDAETVLERILPAAREKDDGKSFTVDDFRRLMHRTGLDAVTDIVASLAKGEAAPVMHFVEEVVGSGVDEREVLGEILEVLRAVLLLKVDGPESGLVHIGSELRAKLSELGNDLDLPRLDAMIQAGLLGRDRIRRMDDRRLILEISLLRMAEAGRLPQLAELCEQIGAGEPVGGPEARPRSAARPAPRRISMPAGASAEPPPPPVGSLKARLLDACRDRRAVLVRTLEGCSVSELDGDDVRIVVETERKLHIDRMTSKGVQDDLTAILSDLLGRPIKLAVQVDRGAAPAPAGGGSAGRGSAGGDSAGTERPRAPKKPAGGGSADAEPGPEVRKVIERFDGRIVDVDHPGEDTEQG